MYACLPKHKQIEYFISDKTRNLCTFSVSVKTSNLCRDKMAGKPEVAKSEKMKRSNFLLPVIPCASFAMLLNIMQNQYKRIVHMHYKPSASLQAFAEESVAVLCSLWCDIICTLPSYSGLHIYFASSLTPLLTLRNTVGIIRKLVNWLANWREWIPVMGGHLVPSFLSLS